MAFKPRPVTFAISFFHGLFHTLTTVSGRTSTPLSTTSCQMIYSLSRLPTIFRSLKTNKFCNMTCSRPPVKVRTLDYKNWAKGCRTVYVSIRAHPSLFSLQAGHMLHCADTQDFHFSQHQFLHSCHKTVDKKINLAFQNKLGQSFSRKKIKTLRVH